MSIQEQIDLYEDQQAQLAMEAAENYYDDDNEGVYVPSFLDHN